MAERKTYPFNPDWCIPVGEVLKEVLEILKINFSDVASKAGMAIDDFIDAVYGKSTFGPGLAYVLETVTNVSKEFWMRLDKIFRERKAMNCHDSSEIDDCLKF